MSPHTFTILADFVLCLHVAFVVFVVGGLMMIYLGWLFTWSWVRSFWFRSIHLLSIGVVVAQAWAGVVCPLTTLEMWLREQAGGTTYTGSFVQHWLQSILYYSAPEWVFIAAYSGFGMLVLSSWVLVRPSKLRKAKS